MKRASSSNWIAPSVFSSNFAVAPSRSRICRARAPRSKPPSPMSSPRCWIERSARAGSPLAKRAGTGAGFRSRIAKLRPDGCQPSPGRMSAPVVTHGGSHSSAGVRRHAGPSRGSMCATWRALAVHSWPSAGFMSSGAASSVGWWSSGNGANRPKWPSRRPPQAMPAIVQAMWPSRSATIRFWCGMPARCATATAAATSRACSISSSARLYDAGSSAAQRTAYDLPSTTRATGAPSNVTTSNWTGAPPLTSMRSTT